MPTQDGHAVYWEVSGNTTGIPVVYLHGGPGAELSPGHRAYVDPNRFMVVGIQQRGAGRSTPSAADDVRRLAQNTTQHLIGDIEQLRDLLRIECWAVIGVSWGSTLALAYAETHPDRVTAIGLLAVTAGTREEVMWITEGVGRVFPEAWQAFRESSGATGGERLVDAYRRLLTSPDPAVRRAAVEAWITWEDTHVSLDPAGAKPFGGNDEQRYSFATLVTHYWSNDLFLPGDAVMRDRQRVAHIPAVLIHGRRDISGPASTAWRVHEAWPASRLVIVEDEGHGGPKMVSTLRRAFDNFPDVNQA